MQKDTISINGGDELECAFEELGQTNLIVDTVYKGRGKSEAEGIRSPFKAITWLQ